MQARAGVLSIFHDVLRDLGFFQNIHPLSLGCGPHPTVHIMASVFKVAGGRRREEGEGKVYVSSVSWGRV